MLSIILPIITLTIILLYINFKIIELENHFDWLKEKFYSLDDAQTKHAINTRIKLLALRDLSSMIAEKNGYVVKVSTSLLTNTEYFTLEKTQTKKQIKTCQPKPKK